MTTPGEVAELTTLRDAVPPAPNMVFQAEIGKPIFAYLDDGTAILVTYVGERTAAFERLGQSHAAPRELLNQAKIRVNPDTLHWERVSPRLYGKHAGGMMGQKAHRCAQCRRTVGQGVKFRKINADYCRDCEASRG